MVLLISLKLTIDLLVHNNEKIERSKWFLNISRLNLLLSSSLLWFPCALLLLQLLPIVVEFVVFRKNITL
jgi:hypothetical protein